MECHCCESELVEKKPLVYECVMCKHIYRKYHGDSIAYHAEQYRARERRSIGEFDDEGNLLEKFHEARLGLVTDRAEYIKKYLPDGTSCLDIGAGAGTFANKINGLFNISVECTELSPVLISECEKLGFTTHKEDFLTIDFDKKYDVVFAWHVLEHVEDVTSFVERVHNITNRHFIVEVPLLRALDGTGRERKLTTPTSDNYDGHAHYFVEESFKRLVEGKFDIVELREGVQTPALFAVLKRREND